MTTRERTRKIHRIVEDVRDKLASLDIELRQVDMPEADSLRKRVHVVTIEMDFAGDEAVYLRRAVR